ncbi:hypothetical protein ASF43_07155 [Pseudorhodoferax sp. Leaf267]|nr:hypothetical protein ASF43_07155 [Pseudorhodoferax sp. Leaf267]
MLLVTIGVTVTVVALAALLWKVPQTERDSVRQLRRETEEVSSRLWLLLRARQARLELLAGRVRGRSAAAADALLVESVGAEREFQALYLLASDGRVQAAALADVLQLRDTDLVQADLSANALFRAAQQRHSVVWSGTYRSALSGLNTVGVALRLASNQVLVGEIAQAELLRTLQSAAGRHAASIWVVDQAGEVMADTDDSRHVGKINLYNWPVLQGVRDGATVQTEASLLGRELQLVATRAPSLGWLVVGNVPSGWGHPLIRELVFNVVAAFVGCLSIGLLMAPFWARRMGQDLRDIVARAALTTSGQAQGRSWPRGSVDEFNTLSADLEQVAATLQEREQKFLAIFNATPVPMVVTDVANALRIVDANDAYCAAVRIRREDAIGRNGLELGLFSAEGFATLPDFRQSDSLAGAIDLRRADGQVLRAHVFGRRARLEDADWMVWAVIDTGPMHALEAELCALNEQLEARVERRTQALSASNAQLTQTVAQLQVAQDELVRSDKLAALGALVAGVAHELNTPLGNGVMAVSAMADAAARFEAGMAGGLRRADLHQLLEGVAQGVDIAQRNLRRTADLVQSFKQVAVDQTSAQRRSFELAEVVHEMVVSLRPSLHRTAYRIVVDVPATGLRLDSYPGALGQTIGNLIQNAVLHGFDGRSHGTVTLTGLRDADGRIRLRVQDDGAGIAPENIDRVFEPFMTTRQGRGGSGLGLHISRNAVQSLLGGQLLVQSAPGQGTAFTLVLPDVAPRAEGDGGGVAGAPWERV